MPSSPLPSDIVPVQTKGKNRAGGHFFLPDTVRESRDSRAVLNIANITKNVMPYTARAEIRVLLLNLRQASLAVLDVRDNHK